MKTLAITLCRPLVVVVVVACSSLSWSFWMDDDSVNVLNARFDTFPRATITLYEHHARGTLVYEVRLPFAGDLGEFNILIIMSLQRL